MTKEQQQLYWIWGAMMQRCENPKSPQYKDYGGRGIKVCERWRKSKNFLADMSPRPKGSLLDRKENNEGYSPENCVWTTRKQQNSNRRNCIYVIHENERVTLKEKCRRLGVSYRPIAKRIQKGWSIEKTFRIPLGLKNQFDKRAAQ